METSRQVAPTLVDLSVHIHTYISWDGIASSLCAAVIPKVTKHLLSNPVFTCIILAACMEIAVVAGFAAFLAKYLEQQFNLTTTEANQLLGRYSHARTHTQHSVTTSGAGSHPSSAFLLQGSLPFRVRVWASSWAACW